MNKKIITFSMLMFAMSTGSLMAPTENIQRAIPVNGYNKEGYALHIPGPAQQTATRVKNIASISGMSDRGIADRVLLKPKQTDAEYLKGKDIDVSKIDSSIKIPIAQLIEPYQLKAKNALLILEPLDLNQNVYVSDNTTVAKPLVSFTQQASNVIGQSLNFVDTQAQNAGARLGIPNLTGRSRDITNINSNAKAAIKNKSKGSLRMITDAHGKISEIYTPAPTKINFTARMIRSWYDKLSILYTPQGRQLFKDAVSARFKRLGHEMPTTLSAQQAFSRFFANITPSMSLPDFNNAINWLSRKLGQSQTEVEAINFDPAKSYENMPTAQSIPMNEMQLSEQEMMNLSIERSLHDNSPDNSTPTPVQVQIDSIKPIPMAKINNSTEFIPTTVIAEQVNSKPNTPEIFNN